VLVLGAVLVLVPSRIAGLAELVGLSGLCGF
jgi:hypothetical protein